MSRVVRSERGIALAIAMLALVVVGALVTGAFFAGIQEQRLGDNSRRATQAFGVAETGLTEQVRLWDPTLNNGLGVYPADSLTISRTTTPGRTGSYGGFVYRLNGNVHLIDVTGSDTASRRTDAGGFGARQRLGLLTRLRLLEIDIQASLTTQGNVDVLGTAEVNGDNVDPADWTGPRCVGVGADTRPDVAGVRTNGVVTERGGGEAKGTPDVVEGDPTIGDSTFTRYGDVTFAELASRATIRLLGGVVSTRPRNSGNTCLTGQSNPTNWGDGRNPIAPCGRYFPIIYVDGDLRLNGDQGQGVLLVNGDLDVQGQYEFFGIAIVLGDLKTAGGGPAHFWGGVLARNVDRVDQNVTGGATLKYSSCAILTALQATAVAAPLRSRGWVQLF